MDATYFSRSDAKRLVGRQVEALADFPSVPQGTWGTIAKAYHSWGANWVVRVKWDLPRRYSLVDLSIGDANLNFYKRSKPVTDDFSKSDLEKLVRTHPSLTN